MKQTKLKLKDICIIAMLTALGIILSGVLQFRLIGDIKVDLSYIIIIVVCCLYGVWGGVSATLIALFESLLFGAYGISISWMVSNAFIGVVVGLVASHTKKHKAIIDIVTIVVACAIGLLGIKTLIECQLYSIPFEVKIIKNATAFTVDTACMICGYLFVLPKILANIRKEKM